MRGQGAAPGRCSGTGLISSCQPLLWPWKTVGAVNVEPLAFTEMKPQSGSRQRCAVSKIPLGDPEEEAKLSSTVAGGALVAVPASRPRKVPIRPSKTKIRSSARAGGGSSRTAATPARTTAADVRWLAGARAPQCLITIIILLWTDPNRCHCCIFTMDADVQQRCIWRGGAPCRWASRVPADGVLGSRRSSWRTQQAAQKHDIVIEIRNSAWFPAWHDSFSTFRRT